MAIRRIAYNHSDIKDALNSKDLSVAKIKVMKNDDVIGTKQPPDKLNRQVIYGLRYAFTY